MVYDPNIAPAEALVNVSTDAAANAPAGCSADAPSASASSASAPSASASPDAVSARTRANRANARKSTGPRTPHGKRRASRNAVKHGIFCPGTVLPGESRDAYSAMLAAHHTSFNPTTLMEASLVEQIADAQWRLMRLRRTESNLLVVTGERAKRDTQKQLARLKERYVDDIDFNDPSSCTDERDRRIFNRVEMLSSIADVPLDAPACLLGVIVNDDKALDRIGRYEQRLQLIITRSLRQLKELRNTKAFERTEDLSPLTLTLIGDPSRRAHELNPEIFTDLEDENPNYEDFGGEDSNNEASDFDASEDCDPIESNQTPEASESGQPDAPKPAPGKNEPKESPKPGQNHDLNESKTNPDQVPHAGAKRSAAPDRDPPNPR